MLCYVAGLFYSKYRLKVEGVLMRYYWPSVAALIVLVVGLHELPLFCRGVVPNLRAISFAILCVALSMRFQVRSKFLMWCGANLFALYIYQRIPMIVLQKYAPGMLTGWLAGFALLLAFACTVLIAWLYPSWRINLGIKASNISK